MASAPLDVADLAARLLRPERAALPRAYAALLGSPEHVVRFALERGVVDPAGYLGAQGVGDPAEAWEVLAVRGLVPMAWVQDATRAFRDRSRFARGDGPPEAVVETAHPPALAACVALASDAPGVATAEALALEHVARLAPWGVARASRRAWCVVPAASWPGPPRASRPWRAPADAAASAVRDAEQIGAARVAVDGGGPARASMDLVADVAYGALAWREAARMRALIPREAPAALYGLRFDALPDPFDPLVELLRLGYAIEGLDDDAVVLVAPAP